MAAESFWYCSGQPGIPGMKASWTDVSREPLVVMKDSHLFFSRDVSLRMHSHFLFFNILIGIHTKSSEWYKEDQYTQTLR